VPDFELETSELESLAILEPEVRLGRLLDLEPEHPALHDQPLIELVLVAV
jgi:hypothetical protein